jgi:Carbohydrate family 9 binding domain-like
MRQSQYTPPEASLRPFLVFSLIVHVVLFTLITVLILSERWKVEKQESVFIADVMQEERRLEAEQKQAREEAMKDLLADQAMAEMEALVEEQLEPADEEHLIELTQADIDARLSEYDEALNLDVLMNEQLWEVSDELRNKSFEQMRANLKQMKRDMLLSQVRSYIRNHVAPELKQRIDDRLKHELGRRIEDEAVRQSSSEKRQRLTDAQKAIDAAVRELGSIRTEQTRVEQSINRSRLSDAGQRETSVARREATSAEHIEEALSQVERSSAELAEKAAALKKVKSADAIAPAVTLTQAAIARSDTSQAAAKKIDRKKEPEQAKAAQAEADKVRAEAKTASHEATERMSRRIAGLQALSKDIQTEIKKREADAIQEAVVEAATEAVEEEVRQRVENEVTQTAVPTAADRIVKALDPELKRRNLDDQTFRKFLEKDIRKALKEEMERKKPDAHLAILKTEKRFNLQNRKSLDQARREVDEVAKKLRELAAEQEAFRDEVPVDTPSRDAMKQHLLADRVRTTREEAGRALENARKATLLSDTQVAEAARKVSDPAAEKSATEAARAMEREVVLDAKKMMAETAAKLRQAAQAMEALSKRLAEEAAGVKQRARTVDLAKALGEEKAKKAIGKVTEGAKKVSEQQVKPQVQWAARTVDVSGVAGDEAQAEALAKMTELDSKLDQIAENIAEGRNLADYLGMGLRGPGEGVGPGGLPSVENLPWTLPYGRQMSQINLRAYEEFVKDMRDRLNPDNYYSEEEGVSDVATRAELRSQERPAIIYVDTLPETEAKAADAKKIEKKREVPKPQFQTLSFGAAAMMETPPEIDGDLSDWGTLRHGLKMQYQGKSLDKVAGGPTIYVRWSPDGLYFAYTVKDPNGIQPCPNNSWDGDCVEVMVDMANSRRPDAYMNVDSQKFQLTPFGAKGKKDMRVWEMGRGLRGLRMATGYPDLKGMKGSSAAKLVPGGYSVEGFISRRALAKPLLMPGKYVGLNFSLNQGTGAGYQWSASQKLQTWRRPDTWGDLLLLGSDAKLRFVTDDPKSDEAVKGIVPNDVVHVQVTDADMNINTRKVDRVAAKLRVKDGAAELFVILGETGPNTGVFRASVNTQPYFMAPRENTLNVRSGDTIELVYTDARAEYGEKNRKVTADLPVGWPVMRLGKN